MIAALYVQTSGSYYGLDGVEPWDEAKDARLYGGPHPVVAHPPCQRWGKFWAGQPLWIKRTGERKRRGDDAGCFKAALADVRRWGGVLEHPWGSHAWPFFGIAKPPRAGGWIKADNYGGWTCCVEQGRYGHYAPKPTLLYAVAVDPLPELRWGKTVAKDEDFPPAAVAKHGIEYCRRAGLLAFKGGGRDSAPRIGTPPEFRDMLIAMARSVLKPPTEEAMSGQKIIDGLHEAIEHVRATKEPEPSVVYATVRDGGEYWHIECRFDDGQKFAAVLVDIEFEALADKIARALNEADRKTYDFSRTC